MNWWDKYNKRARSIRKGKERPILNEDGNPTGEYESHKMAHEYKDGRWVAFPTIFPGKRKNRWVDMQNEPLEFAYDKALEEGEGFEFGQDEEAASKFAHGSWKPQGLLGILMGKE